MERLGLSGDTIIIDDDFVYKICETNQNRFLNNIDKQKSFSNPYIRAVPILQYDIIDNKHRIKMPRLKCDNCMVWISKVGIELIDSLIITIERYFATIIRDCELKEFNYSIWYNKIDELKSKITNDKLIDVLEYLKTIRFNNKFYYGAYHGDFTLTNLFVSNDDNVITIDAIDFLDTFIDSPIHDICKLRQDTKHLWTINLMKNFSKVDHNRVIILLEYIDRKMEAIIRSNVILSEYYIPFQILNLLRIIPYSLDKRILTYLEKEILELI